MSAHDHRGRSGPDGPAAPGGTDRWLRETFDDAVADVEPRHDLAGVRTRIEAEAATTRRRTGWVAGVAGLAVAATVAAVALVAGIGPEGDPADPATSPTVAVGPTETPDPSEPGPTEPGDDRTAPRFEGPLPVYYVGDTPAGPRLYREFRAPTSERGDALAMAVQMALDTRPDDPDYRSPWPEGIDVSTSYDGGLITLDLSAPYVDVELVERPSGMGADEARMAVQQLVHTAQAAVQQRAPVRVLVDGNPVDSLLGEPAAEPLVEGDPMQVQAPVWVIDPQDGTAMNAPLLVEGRGSFFEATVLWQVLQDGRVVEDGFTTAEECCALSPFRFQVTGLPPGDYVLRVYDGDVSGGEGPGEPEDTKRFTLTG